MTSERWRQAFLDEACVGGQEVRRQAQGLLDTGSRESTLDHPVWEAVANTSASVAVGTHLVAYRIESVPGKGGMGVVYRAPDTKLNRTVAVKLLSSDLANAAAWSRDV
jgi:serine/threonine protein kinase